MLRLRSVSVAVVLVAVALVMLVGPAAAHTGLPLDAESAPGPLDTTISVLTAAPAPPALPWYLPAGLALIAALGWRRPRRALVVTLVLLLCVFAFENALHSVHHGVYPKRQAACTVAAAAAHLAAVQVDTIAPQSLLLLLAGRALEAAPAHSPTRLESPDQGRAPPSATL
ncbi:MAG TPA: hypothetical protein VJX92_19245 [Methylomirabilota bacterium]|nr:hypothetical protein [Methylomirabilota bacterium]